MDLREIAALIANATLFIGADSGIMHLASSSGTRTIGLFSVSNMDRYQPYGTKNVGINTNNKSLEGILDIIDTFLTL
jgi:ADP-heptose:LPS heptosyltransferase